MKIFYEYIHKMDEAKEDFDLFLDILETASIFIDDKIIETFLNTRKPNLLHRRLNLGDAIRKACDKFNLEFTPYHRAANDFLKLELFKQNVIFRCHIWQTGRVIDHKWGTDESKYTIEEAINWAYILYQAGDILYKDDAINNVDIPNTDHIYIMLSYLIVNRMPVADFMDIIILYKTPKEEKRKEAILEAQKRYRITNNTEYRNIMILATYTDIQFFPKMREKVWDMEEHIRRGHIENFTYKKTPTRLGKTIALKEKQNPTEQDKKDMLIETLYLHIAKHMPTRYKFDRIIKLITDVKTQEVNLKALLDTRLVSDFTVSMLETVYLAHLKAAC